MERFVKSLYDRLNGNQKDQMTLVGIMDGAINEMHNNGVFSRLPEELQQKIHSADPHERVAIKTSVAKDVAVQNFIKASKPVPLKNGDIAHLVAVKYDPRFLNSIALCVQGGLEGLYLSEAYKRCEDETMHYYIQTDAVGEDRSVFRRKMMELEGLYENFEINFMPDPVCFAAPAQPEPPVETETKEEKETKKKGVFGKLFGKRS